MALDNFGVVGPNVTRSAMPNRHGAAVLRALGVRYVVKLTRDEEYTAAEEAELLGPDFEVLTFPNEISNFHPDESAARVVVDQIAELVAAGGRVHIHCMFGRDRTGWICALYQLLHLRRPLAAVLEDFEGHGVNSLIALFDRAIVHALRAIATKEGLA